MGEPQAPLSLAGASQLSGGSYSWPGPDPAIQCNDQTARPGPSGRIQLQRLLSHSATGQGRGGLKADVLARVCLRVHVCEPGQVNTGARLGVG